MYYKRIFYIALFLIVGSSSCGRAQQIELVKNNTTAYKIIIPADASALEQKSAGILQNYIQHVSGAKLEIVKEHGKDNSPAIYIGHTDKSARFQEKLPAESYMLHSDGKDLFICGGSGKGLMYGVYTFAERYLGCEKLSADPAVIPQRKDIVLGHIHDLDKAPFMYREVYYPSANDPEYMAWNKLQKFDDLWGLWGHSYNKLVPAKTYFKTHPEYYALVNGVRQPTQLDLSNEDVYKIVVADLKKRMADNPDAIYWSISPNDDNGYCQCDKCSAVDKEEGSPAGSLIKFVNRVAAAFPDKKITTLAYGYTHKAPKSLKPAANVYVFLSDIDAYRDKPLVDEGSAATFRKDLKDWGVITGNLFVWDYITEFTNYLAPFPNLQTLQPNIKYLKDNKVKGIFSQGSGDTYSEWAELRCYMTAKLLWNDTLNVKQLIAGFLKDYYGNAAKYLQQYIDLQQDKMVASKRKLDIYGNPVNEWDSYLSPQLIEQYSDLFDKAEAAVENNAVLRDRVMRARLPLEYTVLQQARFFGIEKHGIFEKDNVEIWVVKPKFKEKVKRFVDNCKKAGVTELSEGGASPDKYQQEWDAIFAAGVTPTKAIGATVKLETPFVTDYPAKGPRTLVDGMGGYNDFSYNWLCFYGEPLVATIDLGKMQDIKQLSMDFLDDPRHWIFLPAKIKIETSTDGVAYTNVTTLPSPANEEHYEVAVKNYIAPINKTGIRYIRISADNLSTLPAWRYKDNKKPMIACDEVYVQ